MKNLLDLTIDEGVLAPPKYNCSDTIFEKYVENLMKLSELLQEGVVDIFMTNDAFYSLGSKQCYSYERLRNVFDRRGGSGYSSREMMILMRYIRDRISSFEDTFKIFDVSINGCVKTSPKVESIVSAKGRKLELEKSILLIAILLSCADDVSYRHAYALACGPVHRMHIQAEIHDVVSENANIIKLPRSPNVFRGDVPVLDDLDTLQILLDTAAMMGTAIGKEMEQMIMDILFGNIE